MLTSMNTVEEVGIYSVAFRFASVVLFVAVAFEQAWSAIAIKLRTDCPSQAVRCLAPQNSSVTEIQTCRPSSSGETSTLLSRSLRVGSNPPLMARLRS
jgi:hypothetical protein